MGHFKGIHIMWPLPQNFFVAAAPKFIPYIRGNSDCFTLMNKCSVCQSRTSEIEKNYLGPNHGGWDILINYTLMELNFLIASPTSCCKGRSKIKNVERLLYKLKDILFALCSFIFLIDYFMTHSKCCPLLINCLRFIVKC